MTFFPTKHSRSASDVWLTESVEVSTIEPSLQGGSNHWVKIEDDNIEVTFFATPEVLKQVGEQIMKLADQSREWLDDGVTIWDGMAGEDK